MEKNLKKLVENISPKSTREIVEDHVNSIELTDSDEVIVMVDRRYAFNNLHSSEHIGNLISGVRKAFGEDKETVLKLQAHLMKGETTEHHDREMNVPFKIHYR